MRVGDYTTAGGLIVTQLPAVSINAPNLLSIVCDLTGAIPSS